MAWEIGAWELAGAPVNPPTDVDAGGPYTGTSGTPISIAGTFTAGDDPAPTLLWSEVTSLGGTFADDSAGSTTFTPDTDGDYTLQFSVAPDVGAPVTDTASLTSSAVVPGGAWEIGAWEIAGQQPIPPVVDAGGPYSGITGTSIALSTAEVTPGTGGYTLLWSTTGSGSFSDTTIQNPTYTPAGTGDIQLTLTADPDDGPSVQDVATLTSSQSSVTGWEIGAWETTGNAPSVLRLEADRGDYKIIGRRVSLIIGGDPGEPVLPITLSADRGTYNLQGFPAVFRKGVLVLEADPGAYSTTGFDVDLSLGGFIRPSYTWKLNEGEGTVAKCSVEGFDGTVGSWGTTPYNNKRWPINEGTGALLNEVLTGDADNPNLFTDITPTGSVTTWDGTTLHMAGSASTATWVGTPVSGDNYHVVFDYTVDADHVMYIRCGGGGNQAAITGPESGTFDAVLTAQGADYLVLFQSSTGVGDYTNFSVKDAAGHTYDATIQNYTDNWTGD